MADDVFGEGKIERAMAEIYGAQYVSLHVRVSNIAAKRLYADTLGFTVEKTEAKYYADGEDAFSMKMNLSPLLKDQILDASAAEEDEGEEVGETGKKDAGVEKEGGDKKKGKKRKVRVGRALGVGDLVERNEAKV